MMLRKPSKARHKGSDLSASTGHLIATEGVGLAGAPDCPRCKNGTLMGLDKLNMHCIDCGQRYTKTLLTKLGLISGVR